MLAHSANAAPSKPSPAVQGSANRKHYVVFKLNQWEKVSLSSLQFKPCPDFSGRPQHVYTLVDGRKMYVSPNLSAHLERLKVQAGETVLVRKQRAPDGRNLQWEAKRVSDGQPVAQFLQRADSLEEYGERLATDNPDQLQLALTRTITAAAAAEEHGRSIGYQIRFAPGDIRAMAISKLIGMQQRFGGAA